MTPLVRELEIMRLSRQLRNLSDDELAALDATAKRLSRTAITYEQARRRAFGIKIAPAPMPRFLKLLAEDAKEMECT